MGLPIGAFLDGPGGCRFGIGEAKRPPTFETRFGSVVVLYIYIYLFWSMSMCFLACFLRFKYWIVGLTMRLQTFMSGICPYVSHTRLRGAIEVHHTSCQGDFKRSPRSTDLSNGLQPPGNGLQPPSKGLQPNINGLQPNSDGLQPNSDGLQPNGDGLQPNIPRSCSGPVIVAGP